LADSVHPNEPNGPPRRLNVLALTTYPVEAAATRFRLTQFVEPLAVHGITLDVRPFLSESTFKRLYGGGFDIRTALELCHSLLLRGRDVFGARAADAVLVQREAMLLGPPVVEYLVSRVLKKPMVLDLDDATYLRYESPTYGRLAAALKWFGKTDELILWSRMVICGNRAIADYVESKGRPTVIIPTVVDTDAFRPGDARAASGVPVLGWIGSHSTFPYLESIFPALERLAQTHPFRLRIVGSGYDDVQIPGVAVECLPWNLDRESDDFRSLDVGLYPLFESPWSAGKSGFKAIQYMAVGIPYVVSPVGACAEIGEPGTTHLEARSTDEWYDDLRTLLDDPGRALRMGEAGRRYSLEHFTISAQVARLARVLTDVAGATGVNI
jgi:glycosyltransferase involved in cell wall biosynthesis